MSDKKKHEAEVMAEQAKADADAAEAQAQEDAQTAHKRIDMKAKDDAVVAHAAREAADAKVERASEDANIPRELLPPQPGDANYKPPELWGRGRADPDQVGIEPPDDDGAPFEHGHKHKKKPATEA